MRRLLGVLCLFALALCFDGRLAAQNKKAPELIKDLADKNAKIRAQAAADLGDLADVRLADAKAALPKLKELQKDADAEVRRAVVQALGKIEPDQYSTLLVDTLKTDKDPGVQLIAVQALQQLGPMAKNAVTVLQELHKTSLTEPATKTKTPPAMVNNQPADPPAVRRAILAALNAIDPNVKGRIPYMIEVLKPEKDAGVRLALVQALTQLGPDAKDAVPAILDLQKASLAEASKATAPKGQQPDLDPQGVRRVIIQGLGRIEADPKVYVPRLIEALKTDKAPTVRLAAVQALGQVGPPAKEAVQTLLDLQKTVTPADGPGFRKQIVDALVKIEPDPKDQVTTLTELLKREKNSAARAALVQALGAIGPPAKSAVPTLLDVQKTSPPLPKIMDPDGVRKSVVEAIGKIDPDPKTYVPFLTDTLKKDRDTAVRQTAIGALKSIGAPAKEALPALQDLVKTLGKSTKAEDKTLATEAQDAIKAIQGG